MPALSHFRIWPDDTLVADPVFDKFNQPFLADRIEKRLDVGVKYVVQLTLGDRDRKGV